jgi:hypothetical protein
MATQWGIVYDACTLVLLEDYGFVLGLITDEQFYTYCGETILDFTAATGIAKKIANTPYLLGVGDYPIPDNISQMEAANGDGNHLYETSDFFLSNANATWDSVLGEPELYRQDDLAPNTLQLYPAPNFTGNQVGVPQDQGGYGMIAAVTNALDFTLTVPYGGGYGTIASTGGAMFIDTLNPGYGLIASMCASATNLEIFGEAIPYSVDNIGYHTYIELVPDSFVPYLKYGVLARIFSADSELRSEIKAQYAKARYDEGVAILAALMGED